MHGKYFHDWNVCTYLGNIFAFHSFIPVDQIKLENIKDYPNVNNYNNLVIVYPW